MMSKLNVLHFVTRPFNKHLGWDVVQQCVMECCHTEQIIMHFKYKLSI